MIHPRHHAVGTIVGAAAGGADAHRDNPLGVGHLVVDALDRRRHFPGNGAGHNHQVGLAGGSAKGFHPETGNVEAAHRRRHHLKGAAGQAKGNRPQGRLAAPVDQRVHRSNQQVLFQVLRDGKGRGFQGGRGYRPQVVDRPPLLPVKVPSAVLQRPPGLGQFHHFNLSSNWPIPDPACARRRPSPPAGWRRIRPFQSGRTVPSRGTWPPKGTETPPRHRR